MKPGIRPELGRAASALARAAKEDGARAITVTAAVRGEGVTTVTAHLARELVTQLGLAVLLIDLGAGRLRLGAALAGLAAPPVALREDAVAASDARWALVDLADAAGATMAGLRGRLGALLEAGRRFDLVLVDAPPLDEGLAALAAGQACGRAVLVVRAGNLPHEALQRARDELAEAGVEISGAIINQRREVVPAWIDRLLR